MKANKFFLGLALIGAILTGCEKDPQTQTGEYDTQSYMSVSIAQAGGTRATTDGGFLGGTPEESKITTVDFYFYNANGSAFEFGAAYDGTATQDNPEGKPYTTNCYTYRPNNNDAGSNTNVEKILGATLVIQHNTGNIPAYMIAVINCNAGKYKGMSLSDVKTSLINATGEDCYVNTNGHIMTNSVYKGVDNTVVMETPITIENLAINKTDALANPVEIYVERVAARVEVKESNGNGTIYNTNTPIETADGNTINAYARIVGWDIVTYANSASLAKTIDVDWTDNQFTGFNWNQAAYHRSYWANAPKEATDLTKKFTWNGLANTIGTVDYCLENTTAPIYRTQTTDAGNDVEDKDSSRTNLTKVVFAAQLYSDPNGGETNKLEVANWYGQNYTLAGLKAVVAQSLKNDLILKTTVDGKDVYTPIDDEQIDVAPNIDDATDVQTSYEVYFKLAEGVTGSWFRINEANQYVAVENANAVLKAVENAKVWNGMSYYIVNIEHLGTKEWESEGAVYANEGFYGVVRNHAYEITFDGVTGLGTPVYDPNAEYPEPVTPENTESFVAARINVLAWHVVRQTVTLQ